MHDHVGYSDESDAIGRTKYPTNFSHSSHGIGNMFKHVPECHRLKMPRGELIGKKISAYDVSQFQLSVRIVYGECRDVYPVSFPSRRSGLIQEMTKAATDIKYAALTGP